MTPTETQAEADDGPMIDTTIDASVDERVEAPLDGAED